MPCLLVQVKLNTSHPLESPLLQLPEGAASYLSDRDVRVLSWGVRKTRQIFLQSPMQSVAASEAQPGESVASDRDLAKWVSGDCD